MSQISGKASLAGLRLGRVIGVGALGLCGALALSRRRRPSAEVVSLPEKPWSLPAPTAYRRPSPGTDEAVRKILLYGVPPVWMSAGVADWICHRATCIEQTSGTSESLIHLLMLSELSLPVLACLYFEITPPVIAFMGASILAHQATALWDVEYAVGQRWVSPVEQQVHSFLELVPLGALTLILALHRRELFALLGRKRDSEILSVRLRQGPLPRRYLTGLLGAIGIFSVVPYCEELLRCLAAASGPSATSSA